MGGSNLTLFLWKSSLLLIWHNPHSHSPDCFSSFIHWCFTCVCINYSGIVVDLFSDGEVLPQLQEVYIPASIAQINGLKFCFIWSLFWEYIINVQEFCLPIAIGSNNHESNFNESQHIVLLFSLSSYANARYKCCSFFTGFVEFTCFKSFGQVKTWLELNDKLMPNGRLMVNCGGTNDGVPSTTDIVTSPGLSLFQSTCEQVSTLKALSKAFPGQVGTFILFLFGEVDYMLLHFLSFWSLILLYIMGAWHL